MNIAEIRLNGRKRTKSNERNDYQASNDEFTHHETKAASATTRKCSGRRSNAYYDEIEALKVSKAWISQSASIQCREGTDFWHSVCEVVQKQTKKENTVDSIRVLLKQ